MEREEDMGVGRDNREKIIREEKSKVREEAGRGRGSWEGKGKLGLFWSLVGGER